MSDAAVEGGLSARWSSLPEYVRFTLGGCAAGLGIALWTGVPVAAGQISALGMRTAWLIHGRAWILLPLASAAGCGVFAALILLCIAILERVDRRSPSLRNLLIVGPVLAMLSYEAYGEYKDSASKTVAALPQSGDSGAAIARQSQALLAASESARTVLRGLDDTEGALRRTREQLVGILTALREQQQVVEQSGLTLQEVSASQSALQVQLDEVRTALGGAQPITRADLDASQRWGWIQGIVVGLFGSYLFLGLEAGRKLARRLLLRNTRP